MTRGRIEKERARRAARLERGLCTTCGRRKLAPGRRNCRGCLNLAAATMTRVRAERSASGATAKLYAARVAAGKCRRCGLLPAADGCVTCETCLASAKQYNAKAYAKRRLGKK